MIGFCNIEKKLFWFFIELIILMFGDSFFLWKKKKNKWFFMIDRSLIFYQRSRFIVYCFPTKIITCETQNLFVAQTIFYISLVLQNNKVIIYEVLQINFGRVLKQWSEYFIYMKVFATFWKLDTWEFNGETTYEDL